MKPSSNNPRLLGIFFLLAFFAGIGGIILSGLFDPAFTNSQQVLSNIETHSIRIKISVLLDLIAYASVVGLGVMLFESLKDQNRHWAMVAMGLFFVEATVGAVSRIGVFALLDLSNGYVQAGSPEADYYQTMAQSWISFSNMGYFILSFFFRLGGLIFYGLFYRSRRIPRWLAGWGILAAMIGLTKFSLTFAGIHLGTADWLLSIPNMLFEPFIGCWLIIKGFNHSEHNFTTNTPKNS